ncbi:hypothetical protein KQ693_05745 [Thermus sp. PS18]|uniref:hypothetical protein n=1 Tax=Thermus sp. PS18 TaxID=2849039 RepID=UPI002264142A|nr:hypothetical protein [Thermus sp. PS18]UZX16532.1 hypothetical protein KQ693_05745 [Thermus sp. PS18]
MVHTQGSTRLREWVERWECAGIPMRQRGESWEDYLRRLEGRLRALEYAWGDWIQSPPRPEHYLSDPHWAHAWPRARSEILALRLAVPALRRALKEVRHA